MTSAFSSSKQGTGEPDSVSSSTFSIIAFVSAWSSFRPEHKRRQHQVLMKAQPGQPLELIAKITLLTRPGTRGLMLIRQDGMAVVL